jgi:hypothetical protein
MRVRLPLPPHRNIVSEIVRNREILLSIPVEITHGDAVGIGAGWQRRVIRETAGSVAQHDRHGVGVPVGDG